MTSHKIYKDLYLLGSIQTVKEMGFIKQNIKICAGIKNIALISIQYLMVLWDNTSNL